MRPAFPVERSPRPARGPDGWRNWCAPPGQYTPGVRVDDAERSNRASVSDHVVSKVQSPFPLGRSSRLSAADHCARNGCAFSASSKALRHGTLGTGARLRRAPSTPAIYDTHNRVASMAGVISRSRNRSSFRLDRYETCLRRSTSAPNQALACLVLLLQPNPASDLRSPSSGSNEMVRLRREWR